MTWSARASPAQLVVSSQDRPVFACRCDSWPGHFAMDNKSAGLDPGQSSCLRQGGEKEHPVCELAGIGPVLCAHMCLSLDHAQFGALSEL